MSAAFFIVIYFTISETRASVLLSRRAAALRKSTGDDRYQSREEVARGPFGQMMKTNLSRPLRMLFTEPILASFAVYISFIWGVLVRPALLRLILRSHHPAVHLPRRNSARLRGSVQFQYRTSRTGIFNSNRRIGIWSFCRSRLSEVVQTTFRSVRTGSEALYSYGWGIPHPFRMLDLYVLHFPFVLPEPYA